MELMGVVNPLKHSRWQVAFGGGEQRLSGRHPLIPKAPVLYPARLELLCQYTFYQG